MTGAANFFKAEGEGESWEECDIPEYSSKVQVLWDGDGDCWRHFWRRKERRRKEWDSFSYCLKHFRHCSHHLKGIVHLRMKYCFDLLTRSELVWCYFFRGTHNFFALNRKKHHKKIYKISPCNPCAIAYSTFSEAIQLVYVRNRPKFRFVFLPLKFWMLFTFTSVQNHK